MALFLVVDHHGVVYAFVTWYGREQIGGTQADASSPWRPPCALPHAVGAVVGRLGTPLIAVLAVAVTILAARRLRVSAYEPEV